MDEMQHAAPGAGARAITRLLSAVAAGALLITIMRAAQPAVTRWVMDDPEASGGRAGIVLAGLGLLLVAPILAAAVYSWRLGARALRENRFPPAGVALVRDVRVLRGDLARRRAQTLQRFALGLLAVAAALGLVLVRLASALAAAP